MRIKITTSNKEGEVVGVTFPEVITDNKKGVATLRFPPNDREANPTDEVIPLARFEARSIERIGGYTDKIEDCS